MIIKIPQGPIRIVIEAMGENEIMNGYVAAVEDSSAHQLRRLREGGGKVIEMDEQTYDISYHGIDGSTWALDHLFEVYFPALQRAATFLAIWGSFERHMNELCEEVATAASHKVAVKDLAGRGLSRARAYLTKVAGLDGAWAQALWQDFPDLQRLRNLFAHGDGHLEGEQAPQRKFAQASPHIVIQHDVVYLQSTFLPYVIEQQRLFLVSLQESLLSRYGDSA